MVEESARYMIDNRIPDSVVLGIVDAVAVQKAVKAGKGASIRLKIGGHITKEGNPPLDADCRVEQIVENYVAGRNTHPGLRHQLGRIAVVSVNEVKVVLVENSGKIEEGPDMLRNLGMLSPRHASSSYVREGLNSFLTYGSIGGEIVMVDCAGFNRQRFRPDDYRRVHRPIFPLDPNLT